MALVKLDKSVLAAHTREFRGKKYLEVAGRLIAAQSSGQLLGIAFEYVESETHYRAIATVKIRNTNFDMYETLPDTEKYGFYTGSAQSPKTGGQNAEKTNPWEVAETSALGRALGFAGFGDLDSIASAEEMEVAIGRSTKGKNIEEPPPLTAEALALGRLTKLLKTRGIESISAANKESQARYKKAFKNLTLAEYDEWIAQELNPLTEAPAALTTDEAPIPVEENVAPF